MQILNQVKLETGEAGIQDEELARILQASISHTEGERKKVLLVPPDCTRSHSGGGKITNIYYHLFKDWCEVKVLPALGTHVAMTRQELAIMFGDIPYSCFIAHNWRTDVVTIGEVPQATVEEISEKLLCQPIEITVNRELLDQSYDLILSIGQVVPHEVVGMANYTKNIVVGCGGSQIINASHILGAFYGMERIMGKDNSPVRKLFDYIEEHFLKSIPLCYVLTVTTTFLEKIAIHGLFIGRERQFFEQAVTLSQEKNLILTDKPFSKVVVYLDPEEFKSTWLGNKAIYRTRMAIADAGELIILAPGVERFGEDAAIDDLIRKYGYTGRQKIIACCDQNEDIQQNLSAAAHLIHGSSDGRFKITYCPGHLTEQEVRGVGFEYLPFAVAAQLYPPNNLTDGFNRLPNGEEVFYISNPGIGLWADRSKI